MGWRHRIFRSGFTLSLLAWGFGAVLLGLGNAFIGPVEKVSTDMGSGGHSQLSLTSTAHANIDRHQHQPEKSANSGQDTHQHSSKTGAVQSSGSVAAHQTSHHATTGALPAHCLFCLDGLSPSSLPRLYLYPGPALGTAKNSTRCKPSIGFCYADVSPPARAPPTPLFS